MRTINFTNGCIPKLAALLTMLTLTLPNTAFAEFGEGSKELTFNISFFHQNDTDSGSITGDGAFGYMLSDAFEVGFRQAIASNLVDDGPDTFIATTSPFLRFNFNSDEDQQVIPYLGIFAGAVWNDEDATGTLGPEAGVRVFAGENVFFSVAYRYEWFFDDLELSKGRLDDDFNTIEDNASDGNHVASVGIGYAW